MRYAAFIADGEDEGGVGEDEVVGFLPAFYEQEVFYEGF